MFFFILFFDINKDSFISIGTREEGEGNNLRALGEGKKFPLAKKSRGEARNLVQEVKEELNLTALVLQCHYQKNLLALEKERS